VSPRSKKNKKNQKRLQKKKRMGDDADVSAGNEVGDVRGRRNVKGSRQTSGEPSREDSILSRLGNVPSLEAESDPAQSQRKAAGKKRRRLQGNEGAEEENNAESIPDPESDGKKTKKWIPKREWLKMKKKQQN
jgi:hypothetical protein